MIKINLNMKYERHYDVIKSVVDKNKKATKAAISLDHIYRLIKKYKLEGKQRFMHRNTGKTPINQLSLELKKKSVF